MKKKIELDIPKGAEKNINQMMVERRTLGIARAIAKRAKLPMPDEKTLKKGANGKGVYAEFDLTQKQIDILPIGLRKMLK